MVDPNWAADPHTSAYVWEAEINGILVAVEHPDGLPETPLAKVFKRIDPPLDENGLPQEGIETKFIATAETKFRARPVRPDNIGLPPLPIAEITLEEGEELVWRRRVLKIIGTFGAAPVAGYESIVFGRIRKNGEEEIMQIFPDGSREVYQSLKQALERDTEKK